MRGPRQTLSWLCGAIIGLGIALALFTVGRRPLPAGSQGGGAQGAVLYVGSFLLCFLLIRWKTAESRLDRRPGAVRRGSRRGG